MTFCCCSIREMRHIRSWIRRLKVFQRNWCLKICSRFPEGFSLKNLQEDMEKEKDKERLYGSLPTVHACTNAWIHGEGLEDFKMAARLRGDRYRIFLQLFL